MKITSVLISLFLIASSVTFGICWPNVSEMIQFEQLRYKVFECDSFSPGLTVAEIRKRYGEPSQCFPAAPCSSNVTEQWMYHFESESKRPLTASGGTDPRSLLAGIVTLSFDKNGVCVGSNAMIGMKQTDRILLWALIEKRKALKKEGRIGNFEKLLAMQFGGAPTCMGYPEQSESARRTFGLILETGSD